MKSQGTSKAGEKRIIGTLTHDIIKVRFGRHYLSFGRLEKEYTDIKSFLIDIKQFHKK